MNPDQYSTASASEKIGLTPQVFLRKTFDLHLEPAEIVGKLNYWTMEQIEKVANYEKEKPVSQKIDKKTRDSVFNYWKSSKDNRISVVAKYFKLPVHRVNLIIDKKLREKK